MAKRRQSEISTDEPATSQSSSKVPALLPNGKPPKEIKRRVTKACDHCSKISKKCGKVESAPGRCDTCISYNIPCTYSRESKKRGKKSLSELEVRARERSQGSEGGASPSQAVYEVQGDTIPEAIKAFARDNERQIKGLVDVYLKSFHTLIPLYHRSSLRSRVSKGAYLKDKFLAAGVMAVCAFTSARVKHGAAIELGDTGELLEPTEFKEPTSEIFFHLAESMLPQVKDMKTNTLYWMITLAFMAQYGVQVGSPGITLHYMGVYDTLIRIHTFNDEATWKNFLTVDIELGRRLIWSMYTLDTSMSAVTGLPMRYQASQLKVHYPSEKDDAEFSKGGYQVGPGGNVWERPEPNPESWVRGFNATTDIHRVLALVLEQKRRAKISFNGSFDTIGLPADGMADLLGKAASVHEDLPTALKIPVEPSSAQDKKEERVSLQATNIAAAMLLLRLVASEDRSTMIQKCVLAQEFLNQYKTLPTLFLRNISVSFLQQLDFLAKTILIRPDTFKGTKEVYLRIRQVVIDMSSLHERLASSRAPNSIVTYTTLVSSIKSLDQKFGIEGLTSVTSHGNIDPALMGAGSGENLPMKSSFSKTRA
ncbi:hypothetical protein BJ875DRAFT_288318 [Amylocarpus encephaloides]|uniref:Zn(2)-C6 fungal-type domain-containing protein n=1 Tax=Amylocarpus encephaloides TaxID=45428 RepID=A0A9P7YJP5_9HELO|nr:hypothetical protein BJ875DRAFT_288318 [Amylocarpus encephaloides]